MANKLHIGSRVHGICSRLESRSAEMNGVNMNAFEKLQAKLLSGKNPAIEQIQAETKKINTEILDDLCPEMLHQHSQPVEDLHLVADMRQLCNNGHCLIPMITYSLTSSS